MAAKVFTVLAILTIIGAAYFGFETEKQVKKLQASFQKEHDDLLATRSTLGKTETDLKESKETLASTQATLETIQPKLKDAEGKLAASETELTETKAKLAVLESEVDELRKISEGEGGVEGLKEKLNSLISDKSRLEGEVTKFTTENAELKSEVETLIVSKTELEGAVAKQGKQIDKHDRFIMQKGIRGRVMAVNSGWNFVVLDVGDKKGAALNRELVVVRGGHSIGKVKITSVEANQSIADIMPRSMLKGMTVEPGDSVIYAGDDRPAPEDASTESAQSELPGNN